MPDRAMIEQRILQVKQNLRASDATGSRRPQGIAGSIQSTVSVLESVYGNPSTQLAGFLDRTRRNPAMREQYDAQYEHRLAVDIGHVLDAALADFDAGITAGLRLRAKGEVLGDFIALARGPLMRGELTERGSPRC